MAQHNPFGMRSSTGSPSSSASDTADYHLVMEDGRLWPAVVCDIDMVPSEELQTRPSPFHLAVLLMGSWETKWIAPSDCLDFDPSAAQYTKDDKLRKAYEAVLGSQDKPEAPSWPGLNYWRSFLLARKPANTNSDNETESLGFNRREVSSDSVKRKWSIFSSQHCFGESFRMRDRQNDTQKQTSMKKRPAKAKKVPKWIPDDPPSMPPPKQSICFTGDEEEDNNDDDEEILDPTLQLMVKEEEEQEQDEAEEIGIISLDDSSGNERVNSPPTSPCNEQRKEGNLLEGANGHRRPAKSVFSGTNLTDMHHKYGSEFAEFFATGDYRPRLADGSLEGIETIEQKADALIHSCMIVDAARELDYWDMVELATSKVMALSPWSHRESMIVAKLAYRVPSTGFGFDHKLREAVAARIADEYEVLRANPMASANLARILREHEDLAERVYQKKANALKLKRIVQNDNKVP